MQSSLKQRILIIDDDDIFCTLVTRHLERSHFKATCAHNADDALNLLERERFDAVILDHYLPGYEGLSLLSDLRARGERPPIVYLTASPDSRVAVAALKAGAADYVIKDLQGDFFLLLENAVTNAIAARATLLEKERAEQETRAARDEFEALAEERALLLREMSHRVSNSLQLIASLLHFQGEASEDGGVKVALKEAIGRVLAVARVHRSLYTHSDVRWVSLPEYMSLLVEDMEEASTAATKQADTITLEADSIEANPDTAVSIGIVTTELVLNALKHAYPNATGPVRIALKSRETEIELIVEDFGVGTSGETTGKRRGLGQRIIAGMAEKLNGSFQYERSESGTKAILTFPKNENYQESED